MSENPQSPDYSSDAEPADYSSDYVVDDSAATTAVDSASYDDTAGLPAEIETQQELEAAQPAHKAAGKSGGGVSAGVWVSLIVGALILILLLIFIIQNNQPTEFHYFAWKFELPLGVSILFAAISGIIITGIAGTVRMLIMSRQAKQSRRK